MVSEIQAENNRFYRLFSQYNRESILIILICITLAASLISWLRAERAIDDAKSANAIATTWQQMYKETKQECRLAQLEIDSFRIELIKAGITAPHKGEKP